MKTIIQRILSLLKRFFFSIRIRLHIGSSVEMQGSDSHTDQEDENNPGDQSGGKEDL